MELTTQTETGSFGYQVALRQKLEQLLIPDRIDVAAVDAMELPDKKLLGQICADKLAQLTGEYRDAFLTKIMPIMAEGMQTHMWEFNHRRISASISKYITEQGMMPPIGVIAEDTGLSRQTVSKHLKEYQQHPAFIEHMELFDLNVTRVLSIVAKAAANGDMRAARLYLQVVGANNKPQTSTVVNKQNNYIQINNTILSQENLNQLSRAQLDMIEQIVTQ